MSTTLFISDLHLDSARPEVSRALASFLGQHKDCERLYILGDLFEAWLGDDDDSAIARDTAGMLRRFTASGPKLFLMQGNRDFLLGEAFCHSVGGHLLTDPTVIELYGESTLLMHGDTLCSGDTQYQQFRAVARSTDFQKEFLGHSLDQRRIIADQLRKKSKEATSGKSEDIMDVTETSVEKAMHLAGARQLIHGHTHRPARHDGHAGTRWVLGDWATKGWFIEASSTNIYLHNFLINS
ncbi:MAG: UDP-2,3-diacylglucosamine diphosphatase [Halieaceae bacterium]|nr:UDP-2,3-diacylglucosamine diphosphatase [Halieaceae bacterium]